METLERMIAEHTFFTGLDEETRALIAAHASIQNFDANEYIFRQGEDAQQFYLLHKGKVSLEIPAQARSKVVIQTLIADDVLGWSWLFPPYRWHFDARVVVPTQAIVVDGRWLREYGRAVPTLGYAVMERIAQVLISRLQAARLQLVDVYNIYL